MTKVASKTKHGDAEREQRMARVHELVCGAMAALRDGDRQDVGGARAALMAAAIEIERLAPGAR